MYRLDIFTVDTATERVISVHTTVVDDKQFSRRRFCGGKKGDFSLHVSNKHFLFPRGDYHIAHTQTNTSTHTHTRCRYLRR